MRTFTALLGLEDALKMRQHPNTGKFLDIGSGEGSNLAVLCSYANGCPVLAIDSSTLIRSQILNDYKKRSRLPFEIIGQNILTHDLESNSCSVIVNDMLLFIPKDVVETLLKKLWSALKPNGIMCLSFASTQNGLQYGGVQDFGCIETAKGSWRHWCGNPSCSNMVEGRLGASFWSIEEIDRLLARVCRQFSVLSKQKSEWDEPYHGASMESVRQSFFIYTIRKS